VSKKKDFADDFEKRWPEGSFVYIGNERRPPGYRHKKEKALAPGKPRSRDLITTLWRSEGGKMKGTRTCPSISYKKRERGGWATHQKAHRKGNEPVSRFRERFSLTNRKSDSNNGERVRKFLRAHETRSNSTSKRHTSGEERKGRGKLTNPGRLGITSKKKRGTFPRRKSKEGRSLSDTRNTSRRGFITNM